ncbi:hypothetical protein HHK36_005826 [Tetracentron sinense]|uniref:Cellulose synthase-like protein E1 n=1 Tax=Tetracentron sinense TaxID=13715 RepID=A0A834ZW27_TETSI|nr:hypothetical protein HHK36_005826 [Tetracentron sinense]
MGRDEYDPLFETKEAKGRIGYRLLSVSTFICICLIWVYRAISIPGETEDGRWAWIGLFGAELWFGLYWVLTQSVRWNRIHRYTFKDRLSQRYEHELPSVDIFVCTADPTIEPPMMVINTVLSVMAYDYPPEKLSVYLSDDGGSDLTFYALLEASIFSEHWIPFCKKFKVEPRSPEAFFSSLSDPSDAKMMASVKKLYEDMKNRIETAAKLGRVSEDIQAKHRGFFQWDSVSTQRDHQTILQILIDGQDPEALDIEGCALPTLVYLAREKRPQHPHNFKAGAMNALIRVSSKISNGEIILNVDCDMYSNSSKSVRDALCFFMDEEKGQQIAFVQFPQNFENITKNDIYSSSLAIIREVDFPGLDGYGGPLYVGTGCFHRRDTLCGRKYGEEHSMGLKYGCPVEDVITGLSIQCNGWKSVFYNPPRKGFLGVAPTTLAESLVQHKRWSEGDFQILLSKYSPLLYGHGKISPGLRMGYCIYCLWAPNCLATLYYVTIPSLCLLKGISLFPMISSPWFLPFAYVIFTSNAYSLGEFLLSGGTIRGWWHDKRMRVFKRTSSYLFSFIDTIFNLLGFDKSAFVITAKVADQDVYQRYQQDIIEFGTSSPMFVILATLALLNLFSLVWVVKRVVMNMKFRFHESMVLQILLCGLLVAINIPLYQGLFLRKDKGSMPTSLTFKSIIIALMACITCLY